MALRCQIFRDTVPKIQKHPRKCKHKKKDIILDAGCGTGFFCKILSEKAKFVIGIDGSKNMLQIAKKRLSGSINAQLILADVDYLPFLSQKFTKVFSVTLLQNVPVPQKSLKEIFRVCKKNSLVVVSALKKKINLMELYQMLTEFSDAIQLFENQEDVIGFCSVE